jgi:hypothetical protein
MVKTLGGTNEGNLYTNCRIYKEIFVIDSHLLEITLIMHVKKMWGFCYPSSSSAFQSISFYGHELLSFQLNTCM